jgi:dual 3',5'-cyclic-AMP and -GMP phosphodiesterase 11
MFNIYYDFFFQDDRFNHDIDARTGYKTRTLLCMPIKDFNGDVIGVAQVSLAQKLV